MPRRALDLEPYRDCITTWRDEGVQRDEIIQRLEADGINISIASLKRWLSLWNSRVRKPQRDRQDEEEDGGLKKAIEEIFYGQRLTDKATVRILRTKGYDIEWWTVARIRLKMGLYKRLTPQQFEAIYSEIVAAVQKELDEGPAEEYGRNHFYAYMRSKYRYIVSRDSLYSIYKGLYPEGVAARSENAHRHRGRMISPGPNHTWSIDGYCKLDDIGVEIYGAIDVYSRYVTWLYVGLSAHTAVSVASQYLATVRKAGIMPQNLRCDRGSETPIAADLHFFLSGQLRQREDGQPLEFNDCVRYVSSKVNHRIERWWGDQCMSYVGRWIDYFKEIGGEYNSEWAADRIAGLAIWIPIIRQELDQFVQLWNNNHKIRRQKNRPHVRPGHPVMLYYFPEEPDCEQGVEVPEELVEPLQRQLEGFDLDEYLPPETLAWCEARLAAHGFALPIDGRKVNASGDRLHKLAYLALRDDLRVHIVGGHLPHLMESRKPLNSRQWQPLRQENQQQTEDIEADRQLEEWLQPHL